MPKFNLTCEHDGPVGSKNTLEFEADSLPTVLEHFRQFLKGCSFEFDGELEITDVDYSYKLYKELEPDYDDEYEEDSDVVNKYLILWFHHYLVNRKVYSIMTIIIQAQLIRQRSYQLIQKYVQYVVSQRKSWKEIHVMIQNVESKNNADKR